jgi:hypothetical protein
MLCYCCRFLVCVYNNNAYCNAYAVSCSQVLALFNKAVRKLCNALRAVQEKGIEAEINTTTGTILDLHFTILYYTILYYPVLL